MNRQMLVRNVGSRLRLRPEPRGRFGSPLEGDWMLSAVADDGATLAHVPTQVTVRIPLDHISSYATDASGRTEGFLVLHAYLQQHLENDEFDVLPIVPKVGEEPPRVSLTQGQFAQLAAVV